MVILEQNGDRHLLHKFWLGVDGPVSDFFLGFSHGSPLLAGGHAPQTLAAPSQRGTCENRRFWGKRFGKMSAQVLKAFFQLLAGRTRQMFIAFPSFTISEITV